jgi:type IV secretion system protein VirB5
MGVFSFLKKKRKGEDNETNKRYSNERSDEGQSGDLLKSDVSPSFLTSGEMYDPRNPFALGKKEFDNRYERLIKTAASWRKLTFAMFTLLTASVATVLWMAQSVKVVPFIVQVDQHGYDIAVKPVEQISVKDDRIIIARLADFIINVRTVYSDPAATMTCVKRAYNSIAGKSPGQTKLDTWFRQNNPLIKKGQTVSVHVHSVLRLAPNENTSWEIEWSEKTYLQGELATERFYKGIFIIEMRPPTSVSEIMLNPLGVFISDFDITEKISSRPDNKNVKGGAFNVN